MYGKDTVSPLDLYLDPKNPRFIVPEAGGEQADIRKYLITQENVLSLAKSIADNNGLMPGERIVVCIEDGKYVVLEGNRRTCACQIFLNRALIPHDYESRFPETSDALKENISLIEVDIIQSREEAKRFLAVRHIERAREWSTIAKMRFCYEDYNDGKTISQISDRTGLRISSIRKYIQNYKILLRGLNSDWTEEEKNKLNLLEIKPDKLLRMFRLADTTKTLKFYYDDSFILRSNKINDIDIDKIIHIWTRKAFIDNEMDTRSIFGTYVKGGKCTGAVAFIKHILDKYDNIELQTNVESKNSETSSTLQEDIESPSQQRRQQSQGGGPHNLPFFSTLDWNAVDPSDNANKGIIAVCVELKKISNSTSFINNYPICTAFIIRALIEQSLKYHARKMGHWAHIMRQYNSLNPQGGEPNLSFIIRQYMTNIASWIPDRNIRRLFQIVFNSNVQTEKLNLVVHSPESYMLTPDTLRAIPGEGLLEIANYLLR
ncbi:MAG: ParB/Srx family N-terminal domain-containing protein [Desulfobacterales bacterium]|nr:ParB/Srx family N-terminal domain-containing protein [Desulfobacterales bacterium]